MRRKDFKKAKDVPVETDPDGAMSLEIARGWILANDPRLRAEAVTLLKRLAKEFPSEPGIRPLLILALMESNALEEAEELLPAASSNANAGSETVAEEETLGRAGRMLRERAEALVEGSPEDPSARKQSLGLFRAACQYYERAYRVRDGHYPLVNLAELYLIKASHESEPLRDRYLNTSRELAAKLLETRSKWPLDFEDDDVWHAATEAHANILLGRWDNALAQLNLARSSPHWKPFHAASIGRGLHRTINALERLKIPVDDHFKNGDALLEKENVSTKPAIPSPPTGAPPLKLPRAKPATARPAKEVSKKSQRKASATKAPAGSKSRARKSGSKK